MSNICKRKKILKLKNEVIVKFILKGNEVFKINKNTIRVEVDGKLWNVPLELIY